MVRHHNCVTTGLALRLWQVALSRFLSFAALLCLSLSFTAIPALGQSNPVPFVNQPLVPSAVAPGGPDFTLTVNGTGFVSGASEGTCPSCSIGGNGGSGAFGEAVLTVAPGASLTIVVGAGGAGGAVNTTNSGGSGGTRTRLALSCFRQAAAVAARAAPAARRPELGARRESDLRGVFCIPGRVAAPAAGGQLVAAIFSPTLLQTPIGAAEASITATPMRRKLSTGYLDTFTSSGDLSLI
ncbi:MAG: hypothetical protein DMG21_15605 [Acidobacteria bacterium]|nr:MAG: hypothetical protein DMG21_15605 [Acidobacteriota bacterium]